MSLGLREWLVVAHLPQLGPRRLAEVRAQRPAWPHGWLAVLPAAARDALRLWLERPAASPIQARLEQALAWEARDAAHHLLYPEHPAWPALLDELPDPPPLLWAHGDLAALDPPGLAIVGTRRPTRDGLDNAARFAGELAASGFCVISGMAMGIDGRAHRAALGAGGPSIGVLGCGIDVVYPSRHGELYRAMREGGGLLLSEHAPGTRANPVFFPRRNRLITGLSRGVLVVEAAEKSGSLISARLATEQNREVFVLPGSLNNPQARGCLKLIRQGATMVLERDDILDELGPWARPVASADAPPGASALAAASARVPADPILDLLSDAPTPLDLVIELSGRDFAHCQQRLLELELEGLVAQAPGGWVRLAGR
ncbi:MULTISPECIES: DNA-processing protein DprA [unclassified Modicisalibacter]|uniref:DNA-processing protein DprA n=1 Tax=unclassified Modicisalibacter TaxID=2679913 RepID=UPI001CCDBF27|nr:DNA-processing protein DprA [Modicisalibacter sp. R2A 31.J]MBZ9577000.1 DNA-processing protein DprA [Modicisalibacter sp. MOD 31.J]